MGKTKEPENENEKPSGTPTEIEVPPKPGKTKEAKAIKEALAESPKGQDPAVLIDLYRTGFDYGFELGQKYEPRKPKSFWDI